MVVILSLLYIIICIGRIWFSIWDKNLQEMISEAAAAIITQDRKLKQEAYLIS